MTVQTTIPTQTPCLLYLGCSWHDFNQTLKKGPLDHLEQIFTPPKIRQKIILTKKQIFKKIFALKKNCKNNLPKK